MAETPDYSNMKVVLIDDNEMVLSSVESALREFGFTIRSFKDPLKGIKWIGDNGVDIVISDIYMPECDGFEVLRQVKAIEPNCDVIFITAHSQVDIAIRALREGATDFFEKPFTTDALSAAIERTGRFRILHRQKELLSDKVTILSKELSDSRALTGRNLILGQSQAMKDIAEQIVNVAQSNATVLITGESGTGKELVANAIHASSSRKDKPFLAVNCPSIPEELFESQLFGHRRGAFTGAIETRGGYIEACEGGTLFLDEIGDLPLKSQAKILRLLEQKVYLPIGENKEKVANVRIVAATNQRIEKLVKEKMFREDLYYRLSVCAILLPRLKDRKEDIDLIARHFTLQFASEMGKRIEGIDDKALKILQNYDFPGNVRELRNMIESSVIHCRHEGLLEPKDLPELLSSGPALPDDETGATFTSLKMDDVHKELFTKALQRSDGNVSAAARLLGISRGKLRRNLAMLNIDAE